MQSKSLFAMTIVSNLAVDPLLVTSVNRIFEQNGIRVRTIAVNYDEYCSAESLQRFAESDFIVILCQSVLRYTFDTFLIALSSLRQDRCSRFIKNIKQNQRKATLIQGARR